MSFQATHLQFANQVKEILNIGDLTRYFSGTLYPDSRYITGVDRAKTHTDARIEPQKILDLTDDFHKGWQVHLWYDKLALHHLDQVALGRPYQPDDMSNPEIWIKVTGAKLVEDLFWWKNADWNNILPYLKPTDNPFQENLEILQKWYQHFIDFYSQTPNLDAYPEQAKFMGIAPEKIALIQKNAHTLFDDRDKRFQIERIMDTVNKELKNLLKL